MDPNHLIPELARPSDHKIVFVVADGLGGISGEAAGTELELAETPHLDQLARTGVSGLLDPVAPGITCGSGPGHLALFGYDPLEHDIGRGVLSALGVNVDLQPDDIAARGNFCRVDAHGHVIDRRAGRLSSGRGAELVRRLRQIKLDGVELLLNPVEQYRFSLVLRGPQLGAALEDTDPQATGVAPLRPRAKDQASQPSAELVAQFIDQAAALLADQADANMVLLRGFDKRPSLPSMRDRYGLNACAIAEYPMYRGLARLLGMHAIDLEGPGLEVQVDTLARVWDDYDFFFFHFKATDSAGEDGDFQAKVSAIAELDMYIGRITALRPEVLVVTADHSTPSQLRAHSWHPVPVVLTASTCRRDSATRFGETACLHGGLGRMPTKQLMGVALAHAGRLRKYGA